MRTKIISAGLALAFGAVPLSAQITAGSDRDPTRTPTGRVILGGGVAVPTTNGRIEGASRRSSRIPRGQLPPRGMCRVWIDGVPPGRQPRVTDCATAERNRVANSRVIYGDRESFAGNGRGRFNRRGAASNTACVFRDGVVVDGRVIDVCRDANGNVIRRDRAAVHRGDDDDDRRRGSGHGRSGSGHGRGRRD